MTEEKILSSVQNLNTNKDSTIWNHQTLQLAPHKPFLLLSIMDGIEIGWIEQPRIKLSQDLIETFFHYWNNIMGEDRKTTIALPFYHMQSEPFWELRYKDGVNPYKSSPSLGGLMKRLAYARLDDKLFTMMQHKESRQIISETILTTYFADEIRDQILNIHHINIGAYYYAQQLEFLAAEPFVKYHTDNNDDPEFFKWQKTQQRRQGFGLKVRDNYKHRCAVCRAKVKTPSGESLVEGAHIIPWSKSKNDDPRNGLALCKTHHWMFDAYLLTVEPDYNIKLSSWLKQEGENVDNTLMWEHKKILLPEEHRFLPNEEALKDRFEQFKLMR